MGVDLAVCDRHDCQLGNALHIGSHDHENVQRSRAQDLTY